MRRNRRDLFPGLAVAEVLRDRGHEVLLFISEKEIDTLAVRGPRQISLRETADRRSAFAFFAGHSRHSLGGSMRVSRSAAEFFANLIRESFSGWADSLRPRR